MCGGIFCENRLIVKTVCYFDRRAPSWMFDTILNAALPNKLFQLEEDLSRSFSLPGCYTGILDTPCLLILLIYTKQDEISGSPRVFISLSNTKNSNINNSSTWQIRLTRVTKRWAVAHKSWMARCFLRARTESLAKATSTLIKTFSVVLFLNLYYTFITWTKK